MFWLFALPLLASGVQVGGVPAGLKAQVNPKALEYGKQFGLRMVNSMLKKDAIPDIHGSQDVPLLGDVQYSVTGIQIHQLQLDDSAISFSKGLGVNLTIQNGQVSLSGNWKLRTVFGPDGGTVDITVQPLSLSTLLVVGKEGRGRPLVRVSRCRANVEDLVVKFHGGNSWFFNSFTSVLEMLLQSKLNKQGEFFTRGQPRVAYFTASPFLLPKQPGSMFLLGISEFSANSAASVYFHAGVLRRNFTDEMIPKSFPFRLNTENMGMLIPELERKFPDMPLQVQVGARKQPELRFHPDGVDVTVFGAMEVCVILPNASRSSVFLLNIDGNFTGQFFLEPTTSGNSIGNLLGSVYLKNFQVSQGWSNVGDIKVEFLENTLKVGVQLGLLAVNKHLKNGFALPNIHDISLVDPQITMYQGLMLIATDLYYEPPAAL